MGEGDGDAWHLFVQCKGEKGLVKEMTVRSLGPAPRAAATKRQDGVLSQIQLLRVPGSQTHTSLLLNVHTNTLLVSCLVCLFGTQGDNTISRHSERDDERDLEKLVVKEHIHMMWVSRDKV